MAWMRDGWPPPHVDGWMDGWMDHPLPLTSPFPALQCPEDRF